MPPEFAGAVEVPDAELVVVPLVVEMLELDEWLDPPQADNSRTSPAIATRQGAPARRAANGRRMACTPLLALGACDTLVRTVHDR